MGRDDALKLFVVLNRAATAVTAAAQANVARHGLSLAEFAALEALYHKGPLLVGELQRAVLKSSGGITYLVDRLVERELVERRESPEDRRARYAALTAEGIAFMDRIFPEHARCLAQASAGLTPQEQRQAIELLKALGKGAQEAPPCQEGAGSSETG